MKPLPYIVPIFVQKNVHKNIFNNLFLTPNLLLLDQILKTFNFETIIIYLIKHIIYQTVIKK